MSVAFPSDLVSSILISMIIEDLSTRLCCFQDGESSDQAQTRPNPPQFVQGIISMYDFYLL